MRAKLLVMALKQFVQVIRAVETVLGIQCTSTINIGFNVGISTNITSALASVASSTSLDSEVASVIRDSIPVLLQVVNKYSDFQFFAGWNSQGRTPLTTSFMDVGWQYDNPPNPADAADGPQGYDNHLYYSFGGVADPTEQAYMESICNLKRAQKDAALGNTNLWFGEWGLPTQFDATDAFLYKWADAQKLMYSQGAGWYFWNFKVEQSVLAGNLSRQWSYMQGVELGYLTRDPTQYHDPDVCKPYINTTSTP